MKSRPAHPNDESPGGLLSVPINEDETLQSVFDASYEGFWSQELGSERLDDDLRLITQLGELRAGTRVLDLACAYGRISNGLASAGYDVTAVDASAAMIRSARAHAERLGVRVEYIHENWIDLEPAGRFDCVLLWFTSFGYLSENDNFRILEKAREFLNNDGRLLIETRHWDRMPREFDGTSVRRNENDYLIEFHTYDPIRGIQITEQRLILSDRRIKREYRLRRYSFPELRTMSLRAGFRSVDGYDESGRTLSTDSHRSIVLARR